MHVGHPFFGQAVSKWRRRIDLGSSTHYHHPFLGNMLVHPSHRAVSSTSAAEEEPGAGWELVRGGRFAALRESTPGSWAVTVFVNPNPGAGTHGPSSLAGSVAPVAKRLNSRLINSPPRCALRSISRTGRFKRLQGGSFHPSTWAFISTAVVVFASSCTRSAQSPLKGREECRFPGSHSSRPCPAEDIWLVSSLPAIGKRSSRFAKGCICVTDRKST